MCFFRSAEMKRKAIITSPHHKMITVLLMTVTNTKLNVVIHCYLSINSSFNTPNVTAVSQRTPTILKWGPHLGHCHTYNVAVAPRLKTCSSAVEKVGLWCLSSLLWSKHE